MNIPELFIFVMKRIITGIILAALLNIVNSCQGLTDFIPPDFDEKLCVTAVINSGRDQNIIIIEKSFQNEYPSEVKAYLENLSVIIKSESDVVFEYLNPKSQNRTDTVHLPIGLKFNSDQKYSLIISEKNSESITSEIVVPQPPAIPEISVEGSVQTFLPPPLECHNPVKSIVLNVKFRSDKDCFYYLDIEGDLIPLYKNFPLNLIDYDIIESNTSYFKTYLYGFGSVGFPGCTLTPFPFIPGGTYQPCFFDSKTIPGNISNIKIKININNFYYDYNKPIRITLNSIPKDLYTYQKNYFTYLETLFDPFSEPVYIKGNIKGGFGIFSICSSKQYSLVLTN
jgi:hypothetical protein